MIDEQETEEEREARLAKRRRSQRRAAIAAVIAVASVGGFLYVKYGVKKQGLGGPCKFAMHCLPEAPQCLRLTLDAEGACSRACEVGKDCAPGIPCVKVGLGETDEHGVPLEGGYCIPQTLLDARKRSIDAGAVVDAGHLDSWLPVPEVPDQLEGELTLDARGATKTITVKGSLLLVDLGGQKRRILDASTLRSFTVDDGKRDFGVVGLGGAPGNIDVQKTEEKARVADRDCVIWRLVDRRTTWEACVVPGGAYLDPTSHVAAPWARELAVRDMFPLRLVARDAKGHEVTELAVTRLDTHHVDAERFAIPHAYRNLAGN